MVSLKTLLVSKRCLDFWIPFQESKPNPKCPLSSMWQFTKLHKWHVHDAPCFSAKGFRLYQSEIVQKLLTVSQQPWLDVRTSPCSSRLNADFKGTRPNKLVRAKRGGQRWLADPFFACSSPFNSSCQPYPWKWGSLCCQGCPSEPWGLICGQLWILGDSGTGAAVAVVVVEVVVAEVVCRYQ